MAQQEFTGLWWLPDTPDDHVAGTLTLSEAGRSELSLVGSFVDVNALQKPVDIPIILGAAGGSQVTLVKSAITGSRISFPGTVATNLRASLCLLGTHVETEEGIRFEQVHVSFGHLNAWSGISGLSREFYSDPADKFIGFAHRYSVPTPREAIVEGGRLRFTAAAQTEGGQLDRITISEQVSIAVIPSTPLDFSALLADFITPLQNLVSLGVGEPVSLMQLTGTLLGPAETPDRDRYVQVVFEPTNEVRNEKPKSTREMLFSLTDFGEDLSGFLRRWLNRHETLRPIFSLYFATLFNPRMYMEQRFLTLTQAAESYHRQTSNRLILNPDLFRGVRRGLCDSVDSHVADERAASVLKSKFNYLNEIPLKERLRDLVSSEEPAIRRLIAEPEQFVRTVGDTRNYLTHYDPSLQAKAAQGLDLYRLSEQVRFLLELLLLRELGFSSDQRTELVHRFERYTSERHYLFGLS